MNPNSSIYPAGADVRRLLSAGFRQESYSQRFYAAGMRSRTRERSVETPNPFDETTQDAIERQAQIGLAVGLRQLQRDRLYFWLRRAAHNARNRYKSGRRFR